MLTKLISRRMHLHLKLILATILSANCLAVILAHAEVKIGQDPTNLATGALLHTQSDDGTNVFVRKSTAQVGINTLDPQNRLEVKAGTANNSGLRLTDLPNASALGTNASGDVVSATVTATCTCGEIKYAIVADLGANWYKMDGRAAPFNICGFTGNLPDATGAVLVQESGTLGERVSADTLPRSALPNVSLTGTTDAGGVHTHGNNSSGSYGGYGLVNISGGGDDTTDGTLDTTPGEPNLVSRPTAVTIFSSGEHTHAFTTDSINGGVAQTSLTISNLPRIQVNTFVCLHVVVPK